MLAVFPDCPNVYHDLDDAMSMANGAFESGSVSDVIWIENHLICIKYGLKNPQVFESETIVVCKCKETSHKIFVQHEEDCSSKIIGIRVKLI